MTKRGQISLFIILGILLIAMVGFFIYLNSEGDGQSTQDAGRNAIAQSVPEEVVPFRRYVDACFDEVLLEALKKAAVSGGEIYSRDLGRSYNYANQANADGVEMFLGGDLLVPYWVYVDGDLGCKSGCSKVVKIPPLTGGSFASIESQVEQYILENIDSCFNVEFEEIDFQKVGSSSVQVDFSQDDVSAVMVYPFDLTADGNEYQVDEFRAVVDVPFRDYYNKALLLAAIVYETDFLSKSTMSWISVYSDMDNEMLPPLAGTDSEFISTKFWVTEEAKQDMKDIISLNVPLFTVKTSKNYNPVESDSYFSAIYNNSIIPGEGFENYNVNFEYNGWEPYFDLNDGEQVIRPESSSADWFPFFGLNRVRTAYSVSYPVLVSISNPDELNGEGFQFSFATEANVVYNDVIKNTYQAFDLPKSDNGGSTRLCDIHNSEPVSFSIIDGKDNVAVEDIYLTFYCGDESCPIGKVSDGDFRGKLPICAGGQLKVLKPNYETLSLNVDPNNNAEINLGEIVMEPYRNKNFSVKRRAYRKNQNTGEWYVDSATTSVGDEETIILQLERDPLIDVGGVVERADFTAFAVIENGTIGEFGQILPGTYTGSLIGISQLTDNPLKILPQERCEEIKVAGIKVDEECFDIPEETIELENFPGGSAMFEENTTKVVIGKTDLDSHDTIEFFEFYADIPGIPEKDRIIEDLEALGDLQNLSYTNPNLIQPIFR